VLVVHQQYHGKDIASMKADSSPDVHNFKQHEDVWHKSAEHDTSKINYSEKDQEQFRKHIAAAQKYMINQVNKCITLPNLIVVLVVI
jgi:hypothetical protein